MTEIEQSLNKLLLGLGRAHSDMLNNYQRHLIEIADAVEANDITYVTDMTDAICKEIDKYNAKMV